MKRLSTYLLIGIIFSFPVFLITATASYAGDLTNAMLRIDRQKANTATGGLICARTPSTDNGTEAKVAVTFPSGFTVNSSASNWTVTTTNLPAGALPWPGIGTATTVASQTVTFPSSNLATSTYYCFNFAAANTLTTGSAGGDLEGTIATLTSGNSSIDSKNYAVSIGTSDQVSVTTTVPASSTDFEATTSLSNSGTTFPQNTTLNYTITYGSRLAYATNITVEAEWSLGTISGSGSPTVDILDYVIGSASNGYNSTPPVIDTVNRKITWTIASFPGNTSGQTVTFQLKTNASYTGASTVSFDVAGRVLGPGTQTPDSTITRNYQYNFGVATSTNTPTPDSSSSGPTSTPGPAATATPTPTQPTTGTKFTFIDITQITNTSATIYVGTNKPTSLAIQYGTSITSLNKTVTSKKIANQHTITLDKLTPQQKYFFIVRAKNSSTTIASDIYTFTTAATSEIPKAQINTLVVTAGKNILLAPTESGRVISSTFSIPATSVFEFQVAISKSESIIRVQAFLRNKSVLGITNNALNDASENTELVETSPGIYFGRLATPVTPGKYNVILRISDFDGNIVEQKIAELRLLNRFKVLNNIEDPLEGARVFLTRMNPKTKIYENLSSNFSIKNPSYTDIGGEIIYILPSGKYQAEVKAIGFKGQTVNFNIDNNSNSDYPTIVLQSSGLNLFTVIEYYASITSDTFNYATQYLDGFAASSRFFDLIATTALLLLVIAGITALSARTYIPIHLMPQYLIFHTFDLFGITHPKYIAGKIKHFHTGKPIVGAKIYLYDGESGKLLSNGYSNKLGEFVIARSQATNYKLEVKAPGYQEVSIDYPTSASVLKQDLSLEPLGKHEEASITTRFVQGVETLMSFSLELFMLLCLIFEILFFRTLGPAKTLPFMIVTIITILLWLFYARRVIKRVSSIS